MGVEILLFYLAATLILGPGLVCYGFVIVARRQVRLSRAKVLRGTPAVVIGFVMMAVGFPLGYFLWYMGRYFPH